MAATRTTVVISLLFLIGYGACNLLTHQRTDVGEWAFGWERDWPVVPLMIVPYWSIHLAFLLAPFLCRTPAELAVHRRRCLFLLFGGLLGFLLIPLQFAFPRPEVGDAWTPWFAVLHAVDLPHNLFPSLHVALCTVLADIFARRVRRGRPIVHGWFILVAVSTLFTWQHHLIDLIGGFWLAAIALHLHPFDAGPPARRPAGSRRATAVFQALAAIAGTQLARLAWPWTGVFTWPALALAAAAYLNFGYGTPPRPATGWRAWPVRLLFLSRLAGNRWRAGDRGAADPAGQTRSSKFPADIAAPQCHHVPSELP